MRIPYFSLADVSMCTGLYVEQLRLYRKTRLPWIPEKKRTCYTAKEVRRILRETPLLDRDVARRYGSRKALLLHDMLTKKPTKGGKSHGKHA